jgi:hypothetical protein
MTFTGRALMRCTALVRSSGVRNQAFVGESGNKNLRPAEIRLPSSRNFCFMDSPERDGKGQR